jgi:hypothetical protein
VEDVTLIVLRTQFTLGNSGGIVSSLVYPANTAPRFFQGHGVCLGFAFMAWALSLFLTLNFKYENARREKLYGSTVLSQDDIADGNISQEQIKAWGLEGMSHEEQVALGDRVSSGAEITLLLPATAADSSSLPAAPFIPLHCIGAEEAPPSSFSRSFLYPQSSRSAVAKFRFYWSMVCRRFTAIV